MSADNALIVGPSTSRRPSRLCQHLLLKLVDRRLCLRADKPIFAQQNCRPTIFRGRRVKERLYNFNVGLFVCPRPLLTEPPSGLVAGITAEKALVKTRSRPASDIACLLKRNGRGAPKFTKAYAPASEPPRKRCTSRRDLKPDCCPEGRPFFETLRYGLQPLASLEVTVVLVPTITGR